MGIGRLELPTLHLSGVYSNQLSYKPLKKKTDFKLEYSQAVRHWILVSARKGSNPFTPEVACKCL